MNHSKAGRKFGRVKKVRDGLLKSLARSLVLDEKIKTTDAKAREIRPIVEKMVTLGKKGTLASRRELVSRVGVEGADKIVKTLAPKYAKRAGGYTRMTKLQARLSDGSLMAIVEFV
jgi:large subunit ribosomal protein L17